MGDRVDRTASGVATRIAVRAKTVAVTAITAIALAALATWYGYLEGAGRHPSLKLGGALAIDVLGGGLILFLRLGQRGDDGAERERTAHQLALADLSRTSLALCSMYSALIHFAAAEQHFTEDWLYGVFFIGLGVAQLAWAIVVVVDLRRLGLWLGALGNGLAAILYVVTRTYGSLVGPEATTPAKVGFGDLVSTVLEVLIVLACLVLLLTRLPVRSPRTDRGDVGSGFLALAASAVTALALFSVVGGSPFVSHVG